jgi:hypothetical protein
MALAYDIATLPGGSVAAFTLLIVVDLAAACGVPAARLSVLFVRASSVAVAFVITPSVDPAAAGGSVSATTAAANFVTAAATPTSALYTGSVTNQLVASSVASSTRGASAPAPTPTSTTTSSGPTTYLGFSLLYICLIGGGGFIFLVILISVCLYFMCRTSKDAPPVVTAGPAVQPSVYAAPPPAAVASEFVSVQMEHYVVRPGKKPANVITMPLPEDALARRPQSPVRRLGVARSPGAAPSHSAPRARSPVQAQSPSQTPGSPHSPGREIVRKPQRARPVRKAAAKPTADAALPPPPVEQV